MLGQVWMITGDKQETAINIAIGCKLVHHLKDLLIVNAHESEEAAKARLQELLKVCQPPGAGPAGKGRPSVQARHPLHCASQRAKGIHVHTRALLTQ